MAGIKAAFLLILAVTIVMTATQVGSLRECLRTGQPCNGQPDYSACGYNCICKDVPPGNKTSKVCAPKPNQTSF
ncbi:hypothetical protein MTO96_034488 [Rhipicephalus appendiculatus]